MAKGLGRMLPSEKQLQVLQADGHVLVMGGPGSGKTTVSIVKAAEIAERDLRPEERVLFLSFARATVARVVGVIKHEQKIPLLLEQRISVQTYHSFFWSVLRAHGYLIGLPRRLNILTPSSEAVALADIRARFPGRNLTVDAENAKAAAELAERVRLATVEGRVAFDLFATYVGDLLRRGERIRRLLARMYPAIVLDEFQDTTLEQWQVVRELGVVSRLIALADPEQRIYGWIGADPERLDHFRDAFDPTEIDLGTDNYRSTDSEIVMFGDDVLKGQFRQERYKGVVITGFEPYRDQALSSLVAATMAACQRLRDEHRENWSLAILVPTKKMTRLVSSAFLQPPGGAAAVPHSAAIEIEAALLAAEVVAMLLQPREGEHLSQVIDLMCNYFQGKGGSQPTKAAIGEAAAIRRGYEEVLERQAANRAVRKNSILASLLEVYAETRGVVLCGNPEKDWLAMLRTLEGGACKRLREVADEARNIRLLGRGTQLREALSEDWRDNRGYPNALSITRQAFLQEQLATAAAPETGVVVMNMHKAKGKQFDEVIVFEGWPVKRNGIVRSNSDRIVRFNDKGEVEDQVRQNLRVSVTRGKRRATIMTPRTDPCVLLLT